MELEPINLEPLEQPVAQPVQWIPPQPEPAIVPEPAVRERRSGVSWSHILMMSVIAFLTVMLLVDRGVIPEPTPNPDIDVAGQYVLFVVDEDGKGNLTADQLAVTNSAKVANWCTANSVEYRRFDVEEDLKLEEPVWRELAKLVDRPPGMVTLKDGKAAVREFPDGVDAAIDQLSGVFK